MKRALGAVATLMSVLALAACGGDGGGGTPSASEWADSFCSDLSTWSDSVQSVAASLRGGGTSREDVQDAANEVADASETLVGDLQDLGRPDIEAGQEVEDAVNKLADELQTGIGEIERAAAEGSAGAVQGVSATLTTMGNEVSSTVQDLDQLDGQGELRSAFEQSDACQELTRS